MPSASGQTPADERGGGAGGLTVAAVVVPVRGSIDVVTVRLVRRAVEVARDRAAARVILDIDTPGGSVDAMREIGLAISSLREGGVKTTAWVTHHALSAGAYLALACNEIFLAPSASIGALTPVLAGPGGIMQIPDEDVRKKTYAALRAEARGLLSQRGSVSEELLFLAEAMVDPTMGRVYEVSVREPNGLERTRLVDEGGLLALENAGTKILDRNEIGRTPLVLTGIEALQRGLAQGVYGTRDEYVRERLGVAPGSIVELEESWSESAVAWIEAIKPLLFLAGFLLLLMEIKLPGFGIPGILGTALIGLALLSSFLIGLADWVEILLFLLGIGLIAVEIFVMPGTILFGAAGLVAVVFALILSQQEFVLPTTASQEQILTGNLIDLLLLVVLLSVASATLFRFLPRIPGMNRALLEPPERPGSAVAPALDPQRASLTSLIGLEGIAATDLRPSGRMDLADGRVLDVVTEGAFVTRGATLRVLAVRGNTVVVECVAAGAAPSTGSESGEASLGFLFLLIAIGLALVVADVFLVSAGLLAVGAGAALVTAIFLGFTQHGMVTGLVMLLLSAVGVPVAISLSMKALPRTAIGKKLILSGPDPDALRGAAADANLAALVGRTGRTVSMLRPSGFAVIDSRRVDVVTRGEVIDADVPIRVLAVDSNRVVVAAAPAHADRD